MGSTSGLRHELHEDSNKGVYTWLNVLLVDALLCFASFNVCLFSIDHIMTLTNERYFSIKH